jgi:hypothetical protein
MFFEQAGGFAILIFRDISLYIFNCVSGDVEFIDGVAVDN